MPLDASIISNAQIPDFTGSLANAMNLKNLAQQGQIHGMQAQQMQREFGDQTAMRNAYARNIDPNGKVNSAGVLADLATTAPQLVPELQKSLAQSDMQTQKARMESEIAKHDYIARLAGGVTDQPSYDRAMKEAQAGGYDTSKYPSQYDHNIVKNILMSSLSAKDQLEATAKQQGLDIERNKAANEGKKLDVELFKTFGSPAGGTVGGGKQKGDIDPATLVPNHVPPSSHAKVFDEIKAAQNTAKSAPEILKAFDDAAANLHGADFIPGVSNADQKKLHALMGPTYQDVEGTVRQAAMDNMSHNTTPQFGDSKETIAKKREALVGYLTSKSSAPTAKGFGIDLSKYPSTSISQDVVAGNTKKSDTKKVASTDVHPALKDMSIDELKALEAQLSRVGSK